MFRSSARQLGLSMSDTAPKSTKFARSKVLAEELLYSRNVSVIHLHLDVQKAYECGAIATAEHGITLKHGINLEFSKIGRGLSSIDVQVMAANMYLCVDDKSAQAETQEPDGLLFKFVSVSEKASRILKRNFCFPKGKFGNLDGQFCLSDVDKAALIEWVANQGSQSSFSFNKFGVLVQHSEKVAVTTWAFCVHSGSFQDLTQNIGDYCCVYLHNITHTLTYTYCNLIYIHIYICTYIHTYIH